MDAQKVDMFLMTNSSKLPASHIPIIRDRLLEMDESKLIYLQTCDFKDPTIILIISVFLGSLGIDRFLIGDVAFGDTAKIYGGIRICQADHIAVNDNILVVDSGKGFLDGFYGWDFLGRRFGEIPKGR